MFEINQYDQIIESIAEEILREILLRLPTRGVVCGRSVCRQWCGLLSDPSFINSNNAHANHDTPGADGAATKALAVSETCGRGIGLEMVVLNLASVNPMCKVSDLAAPYSPVNARNGFLLLTPHSRTKDDWPVFVCNPISGAGENLKVRAPPCHSQYRRTYAMGFSPSSHHYKLFCFSFSQPNEWSTAFESDVHVLTLGDGNAWHQHPHAISYHMGDSLHSSPPVLMDGKLYVVAPKRNMMLAIDVATEEYCTYPVPPEHYPKEVYPFEMRRRLCVAVRGLDDQRLYFWFMRSVPMQSNLLTDFDDHLAMWELHYTFNVDNGDLDELRGVWHDNSNEMLCYLLELIFNCNKLRDKEELNLPRTCPDRGHQTNDLVSYDTSKKVQQLTADSVLEWDHRIHLPATMAPPESCWEEIDDYKHQWNVCGGYRPSLQHDSGRRQLNHGLLGALRCQQQTQQQLHHEELPADKI
ncbi:hypothetical protein VPH35_102072 [Triticum aestivum]